MLCGNPASVFCLARIPDRRRFISRNVPDSSRHAHSAERPLTASLATSLHLYCWQFRQLLNDQWRAGAAISKSHKMVWIQVLLRCLILWRK